VKRLFADTYFYLAVVNARERDHDAALRYFESAECEFVTTAWVISEVAASLAPAKLRSAFVELYAELQADPGFTLIPPTQSQFVLGLELYGKRLDKDWSLTDCISFVVMEQEGLRDALTGDHHFEQAGFKTLLGR
jgi:predicted nucleic acid-binding protein